MIDSRLVKPPVIMPSNKAGVFTPEISTLKSLRPSFSPANKTGSYSSYRDKLKAQLPVVTNSRKIGSYLKFRPPNNYWLRSISGLLNRFEAYRDCQKVTYGDSETIGTALTLIRAADNYALKTTLTNTGEETAYIYEDDFIVAILQPEESRNLPYRGIKEIYGKTLSGTTTISVFTTKACFAVENTISVIWSETDGTIDFDASGTLHKDCISSYVWDFGDGETETTSGPTVSHLYRQIGYSTVKLTTISNCGEDSEITFRVRNLTIKQTITVSAKHCAWFTYSPTGVTGPFGETPITTYTPVVYLVKKANYVDISASGIVTGIGLSAVGPNGHLDRIRQIGAQYVSSTYNSKNLGRPFIPVGALIGLWVTEDKSGDAFYIGEEKTLNVAYPNLGIAFCVMDGFDYTNNSGSFTVNLTWRG